MISNERIKKPRREHLIERNQAPKKRAAIADAFDLVKFQVNFNPSNFAPKQQNIRKIH
jgi:hypothetical protein